MKVTLDKWFERYQPEPNFINNGDSPFDGRMFETYGPEYDYVLSVIREQNGDDFVWTLVENDGILSITAGAHKVNALGYFVTKAPAVGVIDVEVGENNE